MELKQQTCTDCETFWFDFRLCLNLLKGEGESIIYSQGRSMGRSLEELQGDKQCNYITVIMLKNAFSAGKGYNSEPMNQFDTNVSILKYSC